MNENKTGAGATNPPALDEIQSLAKQEINTQQSTDYNTVMQNRENTVNQTDNNQTTFTSDNMNTNTNTNTNTKADLITPEMYNAGEQDILNKMANTGSQLQQAVNQFNTQNIADSVRIRIGGTKDLDSSIANLSNQYNQSYANLMDKYKDVVDPRLRDQLIRQEQGNIKESINNLNAIRDYRIGTIQDILNAEIQQGEQKLKGLELQYNMYKDVLGESREADKIKREIQKDALEMEKTRAELEAYNKMAPYKEREAMLDLKNKEQAAGLEWMSGGFMESARKIDFRNDTETINKYPNEASIKNNNPTGLTWGISDELKNMLNEAGVKYTKGTSRPEGGNYIEFPTVEDGMKAYQIALTQRGDDIYERLKKWVGTNNEKTNTEYANSLMTEAGIEKGAKFSQINEQQLNKLMEAQINRESPGFAQSVFKESSAIESASEGGGTKIPGGYKQIEGAETTQNIIDKNGKVNYSAINDVDTFLNIQKQTAENITDKLPPNNLISILNSDLGKFKIPEQDLFSTYNKDGSIKKTGVLDTIRIYNEDLSDNYQVEFDLNKIKNISSEKDLYNYIDLLVGGIDNYLDNKEKIDENNKDYIKNLLEVSGKKDMLDTGKGLFNLKSKEYKNLKKIGLY